VDQRDLTELIRQAVPAASGGHWADLGAGVGNFTVALATLLGPAAQLTAVDRDAGALERLAARLPAAQVLVADFRQPLTLEKLGTLDGILMANSLHFVRDKAAVLARVLALLRPGGRLVLVEYDADRGNPWVPHPLSYPTWERLAADVGFTDTRLVGERPSRYLGSMYAAVSFRPV
jgi:trans-aconitate methyltransferase